MVVARSDDNACARKRSPKMDVIAPKLSTPDSCELSVRCGWEWPEFRGSRLLHRILDGVGQQVKEV